jgi:hypothetical protein
MGSSRVSVQHSEFLEDIPFAVIYAPNQPGGGPHIAFKYFVSQQLSLPQSYAPETFLCSTVGLN